MHRVAVRLTATKPLRYARCRCRCLMLRVVQQTRLCDARIIIEIDLNSTSQLRWPAPARSFRISRISRVSSHLITQHSNIVRTLLCVSAFLSAQPRMLVIAIKCRAVVVVAVVDGFFCVIADKTCIRSISIYECMRACVYCPLYVDGGGMVLPPLCYPY